jgi:hypothetical protein
MSGWSIPLQVLADRSGQRLETVARKVSFDVFRAVALRSPVDTGRFRANWNVSYGTPDLGVTASTNQARSTQQVARSLSLPVGGVVFMANGLPYAEELEFGSSKQAPVGMVRVTVREFENYVRRAAR